MNGRIFDASYNDSVVYGAQLNYMNTTAANFMTARDNDDPSNGPAFYFQQFFDKVVVVPESAIQSSSGTKMMRRGVTAEPGEKPWLCVWNNTLLEGFIYIDKAAITSSSTATTTSSTAQDPSTTGSQPSDLVTTTMTFEWTTATVTALASQISGFASEFSEASTSTTKSETTTTTTPISTTFGKREIGSSDLWSSLQSFPLLVKLEERRLGNNTIQPYCQQYQILDSGVANWIGDENGNPIIINLEESDPPASVYTATSTTKNRRAVSGECHCQWLSGSGA